MAKNIKFLLCPSGDEVYLVFRTVSPADLDFLEKYSRLSRRATVKAGRLWRWRSVRDLRPGKCCEA